MTTFYVYAYLDQRKPGEYVYGDYTFEYEPFYVGKGTNNRYREHLWEASSSLACKQYNPHKLAKIRKIRKVLDSDPVILMVKTDLDHTTAVDIEQQLIALIGRTVTRDGPLTNITAGGYGTIGVKQTERQKRAVSEALKGRAKTEEHKAAMREGNATKRKKWMVTNPAGESTVVTTLQKFCEDNKLVYREMLKVAQHHAGHVKFNRASTHRGWKCEYVIEQ